MKVELISPFMRSSYNTGNVFHIPQMSLALLAALTPTEIDVLIVDELIEAIDFERQVDLVGITVNTRTVRRAYEIANEFRRRNIPVVLGGIHPSVAPHESITCADAVVIGEAEEIWPQLLKDYRRGILKKFYYPKRPPSLRNWPFPRRGLYQKDKYDTVNLVQTSRGCPYHCDFCSVSVFYGKPVRLRPVNDVIAEIMTLEGRNLLIVDDNMVGSLTYTKHLLAKLAQLEKRWIGQAPITIANSEKMLKLLNRSGCQGLFVGFETNSIDNLIQSGKTQNIKTDYCESIKKLHDNGVSVLGSFIVGFDHDEKSCFEELLEFINRSKIDVVDLGILTPYPGTTLYERLKAEKRLLDNEWWLKYDAEEVVYKPKLMTGEELFQGWVLARKELYKLRPLMKRWTIGLWRRSFIGNIINWKANMGYRANATSTFK
jgi:radical SAM superfamily enzyme YgiQ (UPF0313 family)